MIVIVLLLIYAVISYITIGFYWANEVQFQAYLQQQYPNTKPNPSEFREDLAKCVFFGMIPILGWIIAIFATGFFQHGWLRPGKRTKGGGA